MLMIVTQLFFNLFFKIDIYIMLTREYMSYYHLFVMKVNMKVFHCSINP